MNLKKMTGIILSLSIISACVQLPTNNVSAAADNTGAWGALGNGYYNNPVLPADYSDPDIIRVGNDFYLITSTFVQSPGITVLHSSDLVNWEIIGGAVDDLTQINPNHDYTVMNSYGRGIWAPCISYNPSDERFYIHFGDPDYGMFMVYTDDIYGEWSDVYEVVLPDGTGFGDGWDDCGVLWDDDGQAYFAATHFADGYKDYIFKMDQDGYHLQDEGVLVHQTDDGLYPESERNPEALKMFKKDGMYYFFHNGIVDGKRKAFIMRSKGIYGEHDDGSLGTFENPGKYDHIPYPIVDGTREPNQGNLISITADDGSEKWFFWTHQGNTDMDGRPNSLIPITWNSDGWPVTGYEDKDGPGEYIWENIEMPVKTGEIKRPQTSDEFDSEDIAVQWMWNYQPRDDFWSLSERPGYLRLKAFKPLRTDTLNKAGNSLIQRMYRTDGNIVTTKMDITSMTDGQFAGLLYMMGGTAAGIGVYRENGENYIKFKGTSDIVGEKIDNSINEIYFKSEWGNDMLTRSYYSVDGITYKQFGEEYQIVKSNYRGGHIGLFCYNNLSDSGYVDFDYFHYEMDVNENPPVIMGIDDGAKYDLPVTLRYSRGNATVNGNKIENGDRISGAGEYTVRVEDDNGKVSEKTFTLTEDAIEPGIDVPFAMNVGGSEVDKFTKDMDYRQDYWGALNGTISNCGGEGIYETCRKADKLSLKFDGIEYGFYKVKLHFIENEVKAEGERLFEIVIQNQSKGDLDIFAEAGTGTPLVKEFDGITIDGTLSIDLEGISGEAMLCGIEIEEGNEPIRTPRPQLVTDEVLIGKINGNEIEPETFDDYVISSDEWQGTLTNIDVVESDAVATNCGVAPVSGKALSFKKDASAIRAFKEPVKNGQVIFSGDYAQGTRMKSVSIVDSLGNKIVTIGYDMDATGAKNTNILFVNGESVLTTYLNSSRTEQMSIKDMVIDIDEGTISYTVSYSLREGSENKWVTESNTLSGIRIRDVAGLLISGDGANYAGFVDNIVFYSKTPDSDAPVPTQTNTPAPTETISPIPTQSPTPVPTETIKPEYTVSIDPLSKGVDINKGMFGLFFEDINFSADGGLYAEMIKNRSFEFFGAEGSANSINSDHSMDFWTVRKTDGCSAQWSIDTENPIHENNTKYLSIDISEPGMGLDIENTGFNGISLKKNETYNFSMFARGSDYNGGYRISVVKDGKIYASATSNETFINDWEKYKLSFTADDDIDNAVFILELQGKGNIDLDMISLFPENTYNHRENGLRADMVNVLKDMNPGFLRFPGGCIVEGCTLDNAYNWKDTVGPVEERKVNWNRWQNTVRGHYYSDYFQSNGLGFYEYFLLCEDLGCEPVPVVNCGMSCQYQSYKEVVPIDEMESYIQDALDLVEFANGSTDTEWGALRASMGHPEPFEMKYICIGNEQWYQDYFDRYEMFRDAFAEKYPDIKLITTSGPDPDGKKYDYAWNIFKEKDSSYAYAVDEHYYKSPDWFFENVNRYDSYDRNGLKVFVGEYAAHVSDEQPRANNMYSALSEAAFMTGLEKNADIVQMASYAPLFAKEDNWQWTPDLIWFNNSSICLTPNYYVQKMYANNTGDYTISNEITISQTNAASTLYTSASYDTDSNEIIIKAVNSADEEVDVTFDINDDVNIRNDGMISQLYAESPDAVNTMTNPDLIKEMVFEYNDFSNEFKYKLKENSFTIFRIPVASDKDYDVDADVNVSDNSSRADVSVYNNTDTDKTINIYLATYSEEGILLNLSGREEKITASNAYTGTIECPIPENAYTTKLFIWENMKPIYTENKQINVN